MNVDNGVDDPDRGTVCSRLGEQFNGEPEPDGVLDGYMIVPAPAGFFTFFKRKGMLAFRICSIVKGWMT